MIRVIGTHPHHNATRRWRASVSNLRWKTHWKRYPSNRRGAQQTPQAVTHWHWLRQRQIRWPQHFNCHASFPAPFATELHEEAYWKHLPALFFIFTAAFRVFEVISQLSYTCVKHSREAVNGIPLNIEQGISTNEMPHACVELTRALLGQSAQAHSVNMNPHPYQTWRKPLPDDWRRYYGNKLAELTRNALD